MTVHEDSSKDDEIASLKQRIEQLEIMVQLMLKEPCFKDSQSLNMKSQEIESLRQIPSLNLGSQVSSLRESLDFAFLYSNPLIDKTEGGTKNTSEPVNFSRECNDIVRVIEDTKQKFTVQFECATRSYLEKVLAKRPKILHIMCHGGPVKNTNKALKPTNELYFLAFEGNNGELYQLTEDVLKECTKGKPLDFVEVVFVNSCHSEVGIHN